MFKLYYSEGKKGLYRSGHKTRIEVKNDIGEIHRIQNSDSPWPQLTTMFHEVVIDLLWLFFSFPKLLDLLYHSVSDYINCFSFFQIICLNQEQGHNAHTHTHIHKSSAWIKIKDKMHTHTHTHTHRIRTQSHLIGALGLHGIFYIDFP